jgi:hypothetical protein
MLDRAWIEARDTVPAGTATAAGGAEDRAAQVVDLQDRRIRRALLRQRGYARGLCEYVPRHRAEPEALGNGG